MRRTKVYCRLSAFIFLTLRYAVRIIVGNKERVDTHCRAWARNIAKIVNKKIYFEGDIAARGGFFIFNHVSYLDIPLIWNCLDGVFVAKKEIRNWSIIGLAAQKMGVIFIDRQSRSDIVGVNKVINQALAKGGNVFVFAEGASWNGQEILPYKPSLLNVTLQRKKAVRYGVLGYKTPAGCDSAKDSVCWWDGSSLLSHLVKMLHLPNFEAKLYLAHEEVVGDNRKELAKDIWQKSIDLHRQKILTNF